MLTTTSIDERFRLGDEIIKQESPGIQGNPSLEACRRALRSDKSRVFRADDLKTGKVVAVKLLNKFSSTHPQFKARFARHAEIIRSFEHPNVVKNLASGITTQGQPFLVMEYLKGRTLEDVIKETGPISPILMGHYLKQIASALDAAHARGIVHRDINPSRVMLHQESRDSNVVKILDFGLAKNFSKSTDKDAELTGKQTILGTAAYLSPEQASGREVDARSDIYSLGVTLYEALTGELPFTGETDFKILVAHISAAIPPFPKGWWVHPAADAIEAVVRKAMSKNPAERPATVEILSRMFQQALPNEPEPSSQFSMAVIGDKLSRIYQKARPAEPKPASPLYWAAIGAGAGIAVLYTLNLLMKWLL